MVRFCTSMQDMQSNMSSGANSQALTVATSSESLISFEKECDCAFVTPKTSSDSSSFISSRTTIRQTISNVTFKSEEEPEKLNGGVETREDGTPYPTGVKLGVIVLAICLSIFLMALE